MKLSINWLVFLLGSWFASVQSICPTILEPAYPAPSLAAGWSAQLIAQGLTKPRTILFDTNGGLLILQQGFGIAHIKWTDNGSTCLQNPVQTIVVSSTVVCPFFSSVECAWELACNDGKTLYASSSNNVYAWNYTAATGTVGSSSQIIITNMTNDDPTTRSLLTTKLTPNQLLISRGTTLNIDPEAELLSTGHCQLKSFNLSTLTPESTPYNFTTSGHLLANGLRNSVGLAEEPLFGGIYSVENGPGNMTRNNIDIHLYNPGEELNFHGYLNGSTENQGANYGFPYCFAVWNETDVGAGLLVGEQFSMLQNVTSNDTWCNNAGVHVAPKLTFAAHSAPLHMIFLANGTEAFISFHGSLETTPPVGYRISSITFNPTTGLPTSPSTSTTSTSDIISNSNSSFCPANCFRPVGMALDFLGRLFVSSDATGEIWVVVRTGSVGK
ncbi:cc94c2f2-758e-4046-afb1-fbad1bacdc5a [Sclerotinia trifoliorum]|uniref:Cc94c2f2-758e-4046-afb1-fbad1bacdc5a n=1 Tax=Sclerotinia trifoliorum TaxID=28548 RepID=A0A8H2ZRX5_9HELO|nr:cc94c2f2-758e-4046-afb1-fbad1bacdc5a [Sclerotinia trifoliorum]